ncbi:unnamed protein product [Mytilus edulis]|uniref:Uncharacterized protein n=1 Tax=Mytilus edulis TaxID=6550 RepID=A0A8S3Q867_MYTED|nr:unnamed protein product [Mytilus edulis]
MNTKPKTNSQKTRKIQLYRRAKCDSIKDDIHLPDIKFKKEILNKTHINILWNTPKEDIESSTSKIYNNKDKNSWITQKIKKVMRRIDGVIHKKKKSNHATKKLKQLKQTFQRKSSQAYWKYLEYIMTPEDNEDIRAPTKRFWTYIKHKKSYIKW